MSKQDRNDLLWIGFGVIFAAALIWMIVSAGVPAL